MMTKHYFRYVPEFSMRLNVFPIAYLICILCMDFIIFKYKYEKWN